MVNPYLWFAVHEVQKSSRSCDVQYYTGLARCRALVSADYQCAKKIQMPFYIYKTIVKQLRCHIHPGIWLTEPHRKSVSHISENRRDQCWYLKQLSSYSRRHPSDKMIKRSAFQTMTPVGQQRCRVQALVWLHLSGCISSEKSLPTLGRKISKENHPPPPPVSVWTVCKWDFWQAGEGNRAELFLTARQPLTFQIYSWRNKGKSVRIKFGNSDFFKESYS